jgi:hypothetical protein
VADDFAVFLEQLMDALPDHRARAAAVSVLSSWSGRRLYIPRRDLQGAERVALAQRMLMVGMSTPDVVFALQARLGCGRTCAYELIRRARSAE